MENLDEVFRFDDFTFEDAVKFFGEKVPLTPSQFYKLKDKYKGLAFTVSGYTNAEVLNQFYNEVQKALEQGTTVKEFKDTMNEFLERNGLEGITNFQADNIFRTNIQTAFQVGHYEQMTEPAVKKQRPYWQYDAVNDRATRPAHRAMDGRVFPADSPIWDTWYPPNGFRCRCGVNTLSKRQVEQRGLNVEQKPPTTVELPTGEFVNVLPDPHFAVNPAKTPFEPDMKGYPKSIKKAYESRTKQK